MFTFATKAYRIVTGPGVAAVGSYTAWLPGGRLVLFHGRSLMDLFVADISAQTVQRVISVAPQLIRGASITRDGTQLVVSAGSEEGDIWMATLPPSR